MEERSVVVKMVILQKTDSALHMISHVIFHTQIQNLVKLVLMVVGFVIVKLVMHGIAKEPAVSLHQLFQSLQLFP